MPHTQATRLVLHFFAVTELFSRVQTSKTVLTPKLFVQTFYHAINKGGDRRDFKAIAIVGGKGSKITEFAYPCGSCRQVMSEFCSDKFKVILYDGKDVKVTTLGTLLPDNFGAKNLK
jgi:hypothetical protein